MAHFRGTISGGRGEASRLGHTELNAELNGWNGGVDVRLYVRLYVRDGEDWATVMLTGGSNGTGRGIALYQGPIGPLTRHALVDKAMTPDAGA